MFGRMRIGLPVLAISLVAHVARGVPNGDFESGDFSFWTPSAGEGWEVVDFAHPNRQGTFYASTCNEIWPGDGGCKNSNGESDTGILQSHVFEIVEPFLSFRIAGFSGQFCDRQENRMTLRQADTHEVLRATPVPCQNPLEPELWELGDLLGERAYVQVEDGDDANSWAWIAVDDLRFRTSMEEEGGNHSLLEIDADAGQIVFTSNRGGWERIQVMDADGSDVQPVGDIGFKAFHPAWSRDGRWLAFASNRGAIFAMSPASGKLRQLTFGFDWPHSPSWSPASDRIAFVAARGEASEIYMTDLVYGDLIHLTQMGSASDPAWSPDGRRIAFAADGEIYAVEVESQKVEQLTDSPLWEGYPAWSPDGLNLAFVVDGEVYIMEVESGARRRLTFGYVFAAQPSWSPNGRYLAFESDRDGDREIFVIDVVTEAVRQLTDDDWGDFDAVWYPGSTPLITAVDAVSGFEPRDHRLDSAYPNPFNAATVIPFYLGEAGWVEVAIHDALGRKVRGLYTGPGQAGAQRLIWDGRDERGAPVASGLYFYRVAIGEWTRTRKLMLLR